MKKLTILVCCVTTVLTLIHTGCGPKGAEITESTGTNSRIKVKYDNGYNAYYQIIEVDGVEYIAPINGGITPLVKPDSNKSY